MSPAALLGGLPLDLVVLKSRGPILAKQVGPDGIKGFDEAKHFSVHVHHIRDANDFSRLLTYLLDQPRLCVVGAAVRADADPHHMVRRLVEKTERDGSVIRSTLCAVRRSWCLLDWDSLPGDPGWLHDLVGTAQVVIRTHLPVPFHSAAFTVTATGSAGFKPGVRIRTAHLLDATFTGAEIKRAVGSAPIDDSTLRPAQPIYSAAPVFAPGIADPVPCRVGFFWGDTDLVRLEVPPAPEPSKRIDLNTAPLPRRAQDGRGLSLGHLVHAIATAPEGSRHRKLYGCAWRAGDLVTSGQATAHEVFHELGRAAVHAGIGDPPEEIGRIIKAGLERAVGGAA